MFFSHFESVFASINIVSFEGNKSIFLDRIFMYFKASFALSLFNFRFSRFKDFSVKYDKYNVGIIGNDAIINENINKFLRK